MTTVVLRFEIAVPVVLLVGAVELFAGAGKLAEEVEVV